MKRQVDTITVLVGETSFHVQRVNGRSHRQPFQWRLHDGLALRWFRGLNELRGHFAGSGARFLYLMVWKL